MVDTSGSSVGKYSLLNTMPATTPYRKKSYHSMVAPISEAVTTLRTAATLCLAMSALLWWMAGRSAPRLAVGVLRLDWRMPHHRAAVAPASPVRVHASSEAAPGVAGRDCSCNMNSAARSASMITGAFVLPDTSVGMTEQSTTRSPATPRTRSRSSTTASGSSAGPILAVPEG